MLVFSNHFVVASAASEFITFAILARICAVAFVFVMLIQVATLWGTRWGDRNLLLKSFLLSLLAHLCIVMFWIVRSESSFTAYGEGSTTLIPIQYVESNRTDQFPPGAKTVDSAETSNQTSHRHIDERTTHPTDRMEGFGLRPTRTGGSTTASVTEPASAVDRDSLFPATIDSPGFSKLSVRSLETQLPDIGLNPDSNSLELDEGPPRSPLFAAHANDELPKPQAESIPPSLRSDDDFAPLLSPTAESSIPVSKPLDEIVPNRRPLLPVKAAEVADVNKVANLSKDKNVFQHDASRSVRMLQGMVTDSETGQPLAGATIRVDRMRGQPYTAETSIDGTYEIRLGELPNHFAVTVTADGYLPHSQNVARDRIQLKQSAIGFSLQTQDQCAIVLEENPNVHHIGNGVYEGRINSQFQRISEGTSIALPFNLDALTSQSRETRAVLKFLAKGIQGQPRIRINGHFLSGSVGRSPTDGSFGELTVWFDSTILNVGDNVINVQAAVVDGDIDDFEFVNLQIKLQSPNE